MPWAAMPSGWVGRLPVNNAAAPNKNLIFSISIRSLTSSKLLLGGIWNQRNDFELNTYTRWRESYEGIYLFFSLWCYEYDIRQFIFITLIGIRNQQYLKSIWYQIIMGIFFFFFAFNQNTTFISLKIFVTETIYSFAFFFFFFGVSPRALGAGHFSPCQSHPCKGSRCSCWR